MAVAVLDDDPPWAEVYVPQVGHDWREWWSRTHCGMSEDPQLRHPGWDAIWWTNLRHPSPAGADNATWFQVWQKPLAGTDVHPCAQFSSWNHTDDHWRATAGAPLRIAVNAGLWCGADMTWSMGCFWRPYVDWCLPRSLESVWRVAVQRQFHYDFAPLVGEEVVRARANEIKSERGWTRRSTMLAFLAGDRHGNAYLRDLNGPGRGPNASVAWDVLRNAEQLCWQEAEDDLPWPGFVPAPSKPRPRQRSLFAVVGA